VSGKIIPTQSWPFIKNVPINSISVNFIPVNFVTEKLAPLINLSPTILFSRVACPGLQTLINNNNFGVLKTFHLLLLEELYGE